MSTKAPMKETGTRMGMKMEMGIELEASTRPRDPYEVCASRVGA